MLGGVLHPQVRLVYLSLSTRVPFLTRCLMFESFSWPAPLVSGHAVYSWWAWILFRGKCLLALTKMDYSNLFVGFFFHQYGWISPTSLCVKTLLLVTTVSQFVTGRSQTAQRGRHRYCSRSDVCCCLLGMNWTLFFIFFLSSGTNVIPVSTAPSIWVLILDHTSRDRWTRQLPVLWEWPGESGIRPCSSKCRVCTLLSRAANTSRLKDPVD